MQIYAAAGRDPSEPATVAELTRPIIFSVPEYAAIAQTYQVKRTRLGWRILVRDTLPTPHGRYAAISALAWWWLYFGGMPHDDDTIRRVAGAVLCPTEQFERAVDHWGANPAALAEAFIVPEPLALLRLGEVCGHRVAYVDRDVIRIRGRGVRKAHLRFEFEDEPDTGRHGLLLS